MVQTFLYPNDDSTDRLRRQDWRAGVVDLTSRHRLFGATTTSTTFQPDYHFFLQLNATVCYGLQTAKALVESR